MDTANNDPALITKCDEKGNTKPKNEVTRNRVSELSIFTTMQETSEPPDTPMFPKLQNKPTIGRKRLHSQRQSEEKDWRGVSADENTADSS